MFIRLYVFLCGKEIFERGQTKASNKARGIIWDERDTTTRI